MKKYLVAGFLLSSLMAAGAEYSVNLGLDPFRETKVSGDEASADIGLSLGGEAVIVKENLSYGLGIELRTKTNHGGDFGGAEYYSHPLYGVVKYNVADKFYVSGRLGRAFNSDSSVTESSGNYLAVGIGKSIGNYDLELVHESTEIKNTDNDANLKANLSLFEDGSFETVSFKVAYVFGREKDITGPELTLDSKIEGNKITWTYGVTEKKAKIIEVYLNGKPVPVEENGIYTAQGLPTGRYALEVVATDKHGNVSRRTNSVIIVDNNDEATKKELEQFVAGEKSLPIIVGYEVNVTDLTAAQKKRLQDGVYVLDGLKGTLSVVGYTDDTGTEEINLQLSKERADTVAEMVKKVVKTPEDIKIVTLGRGETNFKVTNDSEENRKLNRRIEFEFKADDGEVIASENLTK